MTLYITMYILICEIMTLHITKYIIYKVVKCFNLQLMVDLLYLL